MKNKFFDYFATIAVISAIILYSWTSISSLKEKYDIKISASTFSISGETNDLSALTKNKESIDSEITNYGKAFFVNFVETFNSELLAKEIRKTSAKSKRTIATAYGETDLRYHLRIIKGAWMPTTLDFSTNVLYNTSYILNTPSKLVNNLTLNFSNSLEASSSERLIFAVWDVLHAISGIFVAFIMLVLGSIVGLIFHPVQSVINFFPSLWLVLETLWYAISNFKNIFK
ncbi:hypothetical protein M4D81_03685 [Paenibacillus sp. p3-SID867]|uniref:hypothetical protein n=1 Tax=Paenibacillus sp. p3-SID867 TaxID=2916363 RepID=UPI0021A8A40B|nr:hypothetical protein [Paenibacillus sp. p3-SID867]MCT1398101.1 hypothetical protein [Paenibacillus sp. p3-SID867]